MFNGSGKVGASTIVRSKNSKAGSCLNSLVLKSNLLSYSRHIEYLCLCIWRCNLCNFNGPQWAPKIICSSKFPTSAFQLAVIISTWCVPCWAFHHALTYSLEFELLYLQVWSCNFVIPFLLVNFNKKLFSVCTPLQQFLSLPPSIRCSVAWWNLECFQRNDEPFMIHEHVRSLIC